MDVDYVKIEEVYRNSARKGLMTIYKNKSKWDVSNVLFENNEIIIYSKENRLREMNHIDYGLGILNKQVFEDYKEVIFDLTHVYEKLVEEKQLLGYEIFERFYEIGSKEGLNDLERKIKGLK